MRISKNQYERLTKLVNRAQRRQRELSMIFSSIGEIMNEKNNESLSIPPEGFIINPINHEQTK